MSESYVEVTTSPLLGEHTREIFSELLGMDESQIEQLKEEAAI
jgi:crotonobetainyl-CoA:carnitine CoA-transferase CaiB-like acyl-CoA transferase